MNGQSLDEVLARALNYMRPVAPVYIVAVLATLTVLGILAVMTFGLDVSDRRFAFMGLFFEMSTSDAFCLACAWTKLILLIAELFSFQALSACHYLAFLTPGLLYCMQPRQLKKVPGYFGWLLVELLGLLSSNLVCGFYLEMSGEITVLIVYLFIAVFMAAFGVYRFVIELEEVSNRRRIRKDSTWRKN